MKCGDSLLNEAFVFVVAILPSQIFLIRRNE